MDHLNPSDDTAAGIRIISDQKKTHIQCNQTEIYMCFTYIYLYLYLYLYLYHLIPIVILMPIRIHILTYNI